MPQPQKTRQPKPLYKRKAPKPSTGKAGSPLPAASGSGTATGAHGVTRPTNDTTHYHPIAAAHFTLRDDGSIEILDEAPPVEELKAPPPSPPQLLLQDEQHGIRLYHGNSFEILDAIYAKHGDKGYFDCIFADPPYFLSNGGITCHAGKMVKVDKGDWDKSQGTEVNHEFNRAWLERCQRVLKPNGTLWVSGTHHVIFSIGYAMQQLGFKILNDIAWEKPNPPPNLSCRYFTHSTETILWAAKTEKSRHVFNYPEMRKVTGKQMKTVWTMSAPGGAEKEHGKHPTQKPLALIERCLLASTNPGDLVLDPFLGGGTTAVAALRIKRRCVGIELDAHHAQLAVKRADGEIILLWLREFRVNVAVAIFSQNDLDLFGGKMDRINGVKDGEPKTECIFHETKFVFLSCAAVSSTSVVHTTVDVSLQEAWAKTPTGKLRETTHVVRCVTEILRLKRND